MADKKHSANQDENFNVIDLLLQLQTKDNETQIEIIKDKVLNLEKKELEFSDLLKLQVANERNSLKRHESLEHDLRKYGAKELGQLLVPELELLNKVLASLANHENKELKNYLIGFEMVVKKIDNVLNEVGISKMNLKIGDQFDEKFQEAVESIETSEFQPNQIVEIVHDGYMIYDRVLVHAKVKIAQAKQQVENEGEN
jgi:molecular chaperone GrpE